MKRVSHKVCTRCNCCSILLEVRPGGKICSKCYGNYDYSEKNSMVPIWVDDHGVTHRDIPEELALLTIAEKLLIQRVSPLVPIVHIKNGTLGIQGHVCSFMQNIQDLAQTLPQLPQDVKALRMIRTYEGATGEIITRTYLVNRRRVMKALWWLVRYHVDYNDAWKNGDLVIDEGNLAWMNGDDEASLCGVGEIMRVHEQVQAVDEPVNKGVSETQCMEPLNDNNDEMECSGITGTNSPALVREAEEAMLGSLKTVHEEHAYKGNNQGVTTMDWPQRNTSPLSEWSGISIFVNAFPWLFPGGVGDVSDPNQLDKVQHPNWGKQMLLQKDGRFARDKLWSFFALNYIQHHRNMTNGGYFISSHIKDPPRTLSELKHSIREGDSSFVSKLQFFSKNIRGSDAYWRDQRAQLYSWINYHIENGNGPPSLFITLSCAEYFWPDMIRLLEERIWIAGGSRMDQRGNRIHRDGTIINLSEN